MDNEQLWQSVLSELEGSLSRANFRMWFRDTFIAEDTGESIVIGVPNTFYLDWIRGKYHKSIADTLRKSRPAIREVTYKISPKTTIAPPVEIGTPNNTSPAPEPTPEPVQPKALEPQPHYKAPTYSPPVNPPTSGTPFTTFQPAVGQTEFAQAVTPAGHNPLDPSRTFDTFIVGNSNRLAHAVSLAAAQEPGQKYNPLFIYGGVGLGKTHLAQAIGNEIRKKNPGAKITYVSCETFTNEFIESVRKGSQDAFKKRFRNTDALLIDDVQFLSGKEGTQEEFFHTFNALHQAKKQIVMTSDREPQSIPELEDRLTSRFAWGMVADIQAPDFETRAAILRAKCIEHNYQITDDALQTLAQLVQSNIRELEGALQQLITRAQIDNQPITIDYVNQVYAGSAMVAAGRGRSLNAHRIIQTVCDFFELKSDEVVGQRRYKELVYPRQLVMYLMRHELGFSFPKIGKELGGKDHTTIMHGVDKVEKELARNTTMQYDIAQLKERLYQN